ncbi:glycosyltransferase family 4 protein [uncultured Methanobacterium sp.]|uniref:glycosyltransferase family 4 protein n=1 Tax=uncultured Methanobacterium sp. TaxID=176306 RepID=UPI002AA727AF|nr:glycosyltransferase family 4 protein [uncultured Methanobacterium sp.]
MKICILSMDFLPNIGGIAAHVYELAKALVDEGNEVHVISVRTENQHEYEKIDGIHIHKLFKPKNQYTGLLYYLISVMRKLRDLNSKIKFDIVHSHSVDDSIPLIFFPSLTVIETEHSSGFLENIDNNKRIRFYRWILNHANQVICPSLELKDYVIKIGINPSRVNYIPNGVDIKKFNPKVEKKEITGIKKEEKIVLCPRRLEPKNGVIYFVKAIPQVLKKVNNVKFLIAGYGSESEKIKNESKKLKIEDNIVFLGSVPNDEMPNLYTSSSIVVLPSLKEATSIAGLEAMASGKPLVGSDVGGIPQIIEDNQTGLIIPPQREDLLASALISILSDDQKPILMGEKAYKKVKNEFDWTIIAKRTMNIYKRALE